MGVKTREGYMDMTCQMNPTAYMFGEKLTNIVDNPPGSRPGRPAETGGGLIRRKGLDPNRLEPQNMKSC